MQFLFLKIIQSFKINKRVNWLFTAIGRSMNNLIVFLIITVPVIFGFQFSLYYIFGAKVIYASTIEVAFFTTFRAMNGIFST